jgi:hypothetical protein
MRVFPKKKPRLEAVAYKRGFFFLENGILEWILFLKKIIE